MAWKPLLVGLGGGWSWGVDRFCTAALLQRSLAPTLWISVLDPWLEAFEPCQSLAD